MSTELSVIPAGVTLPAHLQTPEMAAQIAADNAAAAGGISAGGFPSISIKANKFHIKKGGELKTLYNVAVGTQPALPMMCLELVVLNSNPALSKTYFEGEYVEGENTEPACRSGNSVTPDADAPKKQSTVCATCLKNAWGSAVSKISGKDIKACSDGKQLCVIPPTPAMDYEALGLMISKGSLTNWGKYIQALSGRGYSVTTLVTNVTFDATQNGVLNFAFNRFLSAEEYAAAKARSTGSDVKLIAAQSRTIAAPSALAAPSATVALPSAATPGVATMSEPQPDLATTLATNAAATRDALLAAANATVQPQGPQFPAETTSFGAPPPSTPAPAAATAEPAKRVRRTREQIAADEAAKVAHVAATDSELAHLPPEILKAVLALGKGTPGAVALMANFPPLVKAVVATDPYEGQPAFVKIAVDAAGGIGSEQGGKAYTALTGKEPAAPPVVAPQAAVAVTLAAPVTAAATPPAELAPVAAPAAAVGGFAAAAAPTTPAATTASPAISAAAASLKEKLMAKLGQAKAAVA